MTVMTTGLLRQHDLLPTPLEPETEVETESDESPLAGRNSRARRLLTERFARRGDGSGCWSSRR